MKQATLHAGKRYAILTVEKYLLMCGIISSLYYIAINVIVPNFYPGYSISSQTISELSAIDAPSRSLWVLLCTFYSVFIIAFGYGIWLYAKQKPILKIVAALFIIYGVSGFFWPPMHTRETLAAGGSNFSDTLHIAFSAFTVLIIIAAIGITAFAYKNLFRLYSIVTIVLLCAFGILTSIDAPEIVKNGPTPWIGIWERILIGVYLLWICIFALKLLKTARK